MADGQKIPTTGIGDIYAQNKMGLITWPSDVPYVPQLRGNLISVEKLVEN